MLTPSNSKLEANNISTFDEEDYLSKIPITVAMCSCGKSWKVKIANLYLYDQESWEHVMTFHFNKEHVGA